MNNRMPFRGFKSPDVQVEGDRILITPEYQEAMYRDANGMDLQRMQQEDPEARPMTMSTKAPGHSWGA
jgi:hypothetical protein